jgi:hypothetical protein
MTPEEWADTWLDNDRVMTGDTRGDLARMFAQAITEERAACADFMGRACARECGCNEVCYYAAAIRARH